MRADKRAVVWFNKHRKAIMRSGRLALAGFLIGIASPAVLEAQLVDRTKERVGPDPAGRNLSLERRADIYMARKMYREAGDAYKQAIRQEPDSAKLVNKLGISYHQMMLLNSARREYERAWKLDRSYGQALNNLGTVYHAQGSYRRAIRTYKKALQTSPTRRRSTAIWARRTSRGASTRTLPRRTLKRCGWTRTCSRREARSEPCSRSALSATRGKYYYFMAQAYAGVEQWDRAILYLRKALEEGHGNRRKVANDEAFKAMHELPAFQRIAFPETIAEASPDTRNR